MARKRVDPKSRPADGLVPYDQFDNLDPDREYVVANPNDELTGVPVYEAKGWEIELKRPGGPKSRVGRTTAEGQAVTVLGGVLMSRTKEDGEVEFRAGQSRADGWDRRMTGGNMLEDSARGQTHRIGVDRDPQFHSAPFTEVEGA